MKPPMNPLDIMNMLGGAAQRKAQLNSKSGVPDDEQDPNNSINPKAKKSPAAKPGKQVAAIKEGEKQKGMPGA